MPGKMMIPSECINVSVHYFSDPKVRRLIGLLGKSADVLPLRLWCHCGAQHGETGRLVGYTEEEIEAVCEWWGEKGKMFHAFTKLKLIERKGKDVVVHDWTEWQGHIRALRKRAKNNAKKRWAKLADGDADSNAGLDASSNARRDALSGAVLTERSGTKRGDTPRALSPAEKRDAILKSIGGANGHDHG